MLNEKGERELAYVSEITDMKEIPGYDRICLYYVNGWTVVSSKGDYKIGDKCVFIEPDALCPYTETFKFLDEHIDAHTGRKTADRHKIKVQKFCKGAAISAGLIITFAEAGITKDLPIGTFLTTDLGITYWEPEDNIRKAPSIDKYKLMAQRYPKIFKLGFIRKLMKTTFGKKLLFVLFGRKVPKKYGWKWTWVQKSDQERCQNMPWLFSETGHMYTETTKIDGTSSTFVLEKTGFIFKRWTFYVCSRNVVFKSADQANYHSDSENVYYQVAEQWKIKDFLKAYAKKHHLKGVALQGEIAGCSLGGVKIQGDPHKFGELRFFGFDLYIKYIGKTDILAAKEACAEFGIDWVPITTTEFALPSSCDELLAHATGPCEAAGASGLREGYVYRDNADPKRSFKAVSLEYLTQK